MTARMFAAITLAVALAGCAREQGRTRTLSERERDSLIGESVLPGARVVKRALAVSDTAAARKIEVPSEP